MAAGCSNELVICYKDNNKVRDGIVLESALRYGTPTRSVTRKDRIRHAIRRFLGGIWSETPPP